MSKYDKIQKEALEANKQLPELGLVLFTFGNVSVCDRKAGVFAIKPSAPVRILGSTGVTDNKGTWYYTDACSQRGVIHSSQFRF